MDKVATPPFDGAFPDAEQAAVGWGTLHAPDKVKLHRDAAEALRNTESLFDSRRRELKHWMIVPGGYRQAIEAAADFWEERQQANAQCQGYRLTVSAFTDA